MLRAVAVRYAKTASAAVKRPPPRAARGRDAARAAEGRVLDRPYGDKSRLSDAAGQPPIRSPAENRRLARSLQVSMMERAHRGPADAPLAGSLAGGAPGAGATASPTRSKRFLQQQLRLAALAGDVPAAEKLFQEYRMRGFKPDTYIFDQVLTACTARGRLSEALHWYNTLKKFAVRPSVYTFNILINGCAEAAPAQADRNVAQARWLFASEMPRWDVKPSIETYHVLLKCLLRHEADPGFESVWALVREMKEVGLVPDATTYSTWMLGFRRKSDRHGGHVDIRRVLDVWEEMRRSQVFPDLRAYNTLLSLCRDSAKQDRAIGVEVFREMARDGVTPDKRSLQLVLQIAGSAHRERFACQLFDQHFPPPPQAAGRRSKKPAAAASSIPAAPANSPRCAPDEFRTAAGVCIDLQVCSAFVRVCSQVSFEYATRMEQHLATLGVQESAELANTVLAVLARAGRFEEALGRLRLRTDDRRKPLSAHSFASFFSNPATSRYSADVVRGALELMHSSGVEPDAVLQRLLAPFRARLIEAK